MGEVQAGAIESVASAPAIELASGRYSFYLAGLLAGVLLPLLINIWYSLTYKRDTVSLVYALWVVIEIGRAHV